MPKLKEEQEETEEGSEEIKEGEMLKSSSFRRIEKT